MAFEQADQHISITTPLGKDSFSCAASTARSGSPASSTSSWRCGQVSGECSVPQAIFAALDADALVRHRVP